MAQTQDQ